MKELANVQLAAPDSTAVYCQTICFSMGSISRIRDPKTVAAGSPDALGLCVSEAARHTHTAGGSSAAGTAHYRAVQGVVAARDGSRDGAQRW